jgi:glucose-1-phosphate cytidylyltransferase
MAAVKAVILAGGMGTRISEEKGVRPKPMVEVGAKPLLWHIMKIYTHHGITDFVICLGHRGDVIKEYFANYYLHTGDVTFDMTSNSMEVHRSDAEPWRVTLIETGEETMTGGRLKRVLPYVADGDFCMTYGDGLADIDLGALLRFHAEQNALATLTAVNPPGRWGILDVRDDRIRGFREKPVDGGWVNGGFFVLSPRVADYIDGDETIWEREPLERLAAEGQLASFRHDGFFQPVDTLRDRRVLDELWQTGRAPWKLWS